MNKKIICLENGKHKWIMPGKKYKFVYIIKDDRGRRRSRIIKEKRECIGIYRYFAVFRSSCGWLESFRYEELQKVIEGKGNYEIESWR